MSDDEFLRSKSRRFRIRVKTELVVSKFWFHQFFIFRISDLVVHFHGRKGSDTI